MPRKINMDWLGDNEIALEENESFVFTNRQIITWRGKIPKGAFVIYRYKDNTIRVKLKSEDTT